MSLLIEVLCVRKKTRNFYKKILSFFTLKINAIIALLVLFIKLTMCFCVYSANIFTKLILSFSCFIFCFLFWFLPVFNNQYCYYTYNSFSCQYTYFIKENTWIFAFNIQVFFWYFIFDLLMYKLVYEDIVNLLKLQYKFVIYFLFLLVIYLLILRILAILIYK